MFAIIGILVVFGAIIGGYLMEHGKLAVLLQPAELLIIGGAALGTLLVANPTHILSGITKGLLGTFGSSKYTPQWYLDTLKSMFDLLNHARKSGLAALEADIEAPEKSVILGKSPVFTKDAHARDFVCDTLRVAASGISNAFDLDQMMEVDMEVHHHEAQAPAAALNTMADSLPGLGIVAAVLGVVITMGSLGGPKEEIGQKVAAALVGTFLGILMCYGFFGPIAANILRKTEEEGAYYHMLRVLLTAFLKGAPPLIAVEFARRSIPNNVRPTFKQVEDLCRGRSQQPPPPAA